ncbi:maleylpyruvate isomerase family mycothiol-dependent enzyme [Paractinoplanes atraurantiacus]|nr:maleylpyruvate isomerase family mycothiol-dependent enzyme [Actinoplanes atraurantiacus]
MDIHSLIAAWALNACSPAEAGLVEAHLPTCPDCAREARRLVEVVARLSGADLRPPAGSLARTRSAARRRRPPATATAAYAASYAAQVAALDLLLTDLTAADWRRIAAYGELSVHDLVAHLAATDGLIAGVLGLPVEPLGDDPATRTAAVLDRERRRNPEQTRRSWRAQADAMCRSAPANPPLGVATTALGPPLCLPDALTARAYETWIHREDITVATGRRPLPPPLPGHVRLMAELAVRFLPQVVSRTAGHVRLELTGEGGGTWSVPLGPSLAGVSRPAAVVTLDVVEFCRLAGDRRDPDGVAAEVGGDTGLAREFLAAVPALAVVP